MGGWDGEVKCICTFWGRGVLYSGSEVFKHCMGWFYSP